LPYRARRVSGAVRVAGALVTSAVFGSSTIEIYQNGYVRVSDPSDSEVASRIDKETPYEKLLSIAFNPSEPEKAAAPIPGLWEGAASQAAQALLKGGAGILKATGPGLVAVGVAQVAKSMSGKSSLTIATNKEIHLLTNGVKNEWGVPLVKKEHDGVGRQLEQVGNGVLRELGVLPLDPAAHDQPVTGPSTAAVSQPAVAAPSVYDRLRELASLHADGVLDDAEFAAAKAQLLGNL